MDPTAVFDDITPNDEFTKERISDLREYTRNTSFIRKLSEVYDKVEDRTSEAVFFIEQVTGHVIPDFKTKYWQRG